MVVSDCPGYGLMKSLTMGLTFAVRIPLRNNLVTQIGIKAGFVQRQLNWNDFVFTDQLDNRLGAIYQSSFTPPDGNKRTSADFGTGGILQFSSTAGSFSGNVGIAVDHLFQPDISFLLNENSHIPRKWIVSGDLFLGSSETRDSLKADIGFLYQNQASMNAIQLGLNLVKYNIYLGGWYKNAMSGLAPNSVIALTAGFKYPFSEDLSVKFMYSYDIQISGSLQGTGGAHEISLLIDVGNISLFGGSSGRGGYPVRGIHSQSPMECSEF
jgi:type IX secretion system PorP/SprF family membrane protein